MQFELYGNGRQNNALEFEPLHILRVALEPKLLAGYLHRPVQLHHTG
jgi:hypothetical protein